MIEGRLGNDIDYGYEGNDVHCSGPSEDTMQGDGANDTLFGRPGNDTMLGQFGTDALDSSDGILGNDFDGCGIRAASGLTSSIDEKFSDVRIGRA